MSKKLYNSKQEKWQAARLRNRESKLQKRKDLRATFFGKLKDLLDKCKQRAKNKKISFDLDLEFLKNLWNEQDGKCAITNLPLELKSGDRQTEGTNAFVVSVDRIDSSLGYTKDNTQLVCFAVNQIKSNFTENQFKFWIRTISREAFKDEGTFNDYPGREYTSSEVEAPSLSIESDDIV